MIEANVTIRSREEYGEADDLAIAVRQPVETRVSVAVSGDEREVAIENRGGELQLVIYAHDVDAPVIVRIPKSEGIIIDRKDYDAERRDSEPETDPLWQGDEGGDVVPTEARIAAYRAVIGAPEPCDTSSQKEVETDTPRFVVNGHMYSDGGGYLASDGPYPPFYIFDVVEQKNFFGPCNTREGAQSVADFCNEHERLHGLFAEGVLSTFDPSKPDLEAFATPRTWVQGGEPCDTPSQKEVETRKEVWVVRGRVTCLDAHPEAELGDVEWQFSDGPPGERGSSADYLSLEWGLADHSGCIIHFVPAEGYEVCLTNSGHYGVYFHPEETWVDGRFDEYDNARLYADVLEGGGA